MSNSIKQRSVQFLLLYANEITKIRLLKTSFLLMLYVIASFEGSAQPNTWVQKSDVGYSTANVPEPHARDQATGFGIGSKGYIGLGYDDKNYQTTNDFWEYDPTTDTWTQKADFPGGARTEAVGFSIGNKGYIGTGYGGDYPYFNNDFWEYNPTTNKWKRKADLPGGGRESAVGFSIGNKGYIGTGLVQDDIFNSYLLQDFWEYNPATDSWTKKSNFGGTARKNAVGFSIGTKGYIGTGGDNISPYDGTKDFWEYDPLMDNWTQKADFAGTSRYDAVGFSIGKKGYIGTGYDETFNVKGDLWQYDPAKNTWKQKTNYGGAVLRGAVGFSVGKKGYIGTGRDANGFIRKDFWGYNPGVDNWAQEKDFGESVRTFAVGFSIGTKGYIGTGWDGGRYPPFSKKDFWEYDPSNNTWTQKADFAGTERQAAVGFSIGSKGYVGTGYDADHYNFLKDFWEYDPATNIWTQKADFGGLERNGAVGFSIGNKGYVGTGRQYFSEADVDFWEYDPLLDTWTRKADFPGIARLNAAGFSIGNKGYVGIGQEYFQHYHKDFWEYNPNKNTWTQKADFGGNARESAAGFSIGNKGYIGTGDDGDFHNYQDFWEYDPSNNVWVQKSDFGGAARRGAVSFSIMSKGYVGTGEVYFENWQKDFWEYTPDGCPPPSNLRVPQVVDTAALLKWNSPVDFISSFKIRYRKVNDSTFKNQSVSGSANSVVLKGLSPNTKYAWQIRSNCPEDASNWITGPNFTTTSSTDFAEIAAANGADVYSNASLQIMPNPNKGTFTLQMHLSAKPASTILSLYNNIGSKVWLQDAGILSGSLNINIALENKLPAGWYMLQVQRGNERMIQKVAVLK